MHNSSCLRKQIFNIFLVPESILLQFPFSYFSERSFNYNNKTLWSSHPSMKNLPCNAKSSKFHGLSNRRKTWAPLSWNMYLLIANLLWIFLILLISIFTSPICVIFDKWKSDSTSNFLLLFAQARVSHWKITRFTWEIRKFVTQNGTSFRGMKSSQNERFDLQNEKFYSQNGKFHSQNEKFHSRNELDSQKEQFDLQEEKSRK